MGSQPVILTINLALLLALIVFLRIRRDVKARSRADQWLTVAIVLVLGLLLATTSFGQSVINALGNAANGISQAFT